MGASSIAARRWLGAVLAVVVLFYLATQLGSSSQTVTIRVLGDEGTPYEISYETDEGSYTDWGTVPNEYAATLTTGPSSEDRLLVRAKKLEGAEDVRPTTGDLVGVDLQLVAEDGTVLDEASMEKNVLDYSLNTVGVEYDGADLR